MGQHKHNPTAIAAKNGELPPKEKPLSKKEWQRMMFENYRNSKSDNSGHLGVLKEMQEISDRITGGIHYDA